MNHKIDVIGEVYKQKGKNEGKSLKDTLQGKHKDKMMRDE
jgi:hypothetical protein